MNEVERRRAKIESIWAVVDKDEGQQARWQAQWPERRLRGVEALALLDQLRATRDVETFRNEMQAWSGRPGLSSFRNLGQMFIHQLVKYTDDAAAAADVLTDSLTVPVNEAEAGAKIRKVAAHIETIKKGGQPAPRRTPFVLSLFWSMADHERWPCIWRSAADVLTQLGWLAPPTDLDQWYLNYRSIVLEVGRTPFDVEKALYWLHDTKTFVGLDPSLVDRCAESTQIAVAFRADGSHYATPDVAATAERNARAILGELKSVGLQLESTVGSAVGHTVVTRPANLRWADDCFRADGYVTWMIGTDSTDPAIWLLISEQGVTLGLHPGWRETGWTKRISELLVPHLPDNMQVIRFHNQFQDRIEPIGHQPSPGQFLIGRHFPGEQALGDPNFAEEIERLAASVQPLVDRIRTEAGAGVAPASTELELGALVDRFRKERAYPNQRDAQQQEWRKELAEALTPASLQQLDLDALRKLINTQRWGGPGPMAILNTSIRDADADQLENLAQAISYLLWDTSDSDAARIDRLLDQQDLGIKGLGESVTHKLLAVAHPEHFLPAHPYDGKFGKKRMMEALGVDPLDESAMTRGELQVASNQLLRSVLEPYLTDDPWGQAMFVYWLMEDQEKPTVDPVIAPSLDELAGTLLLDVAFLETVRELLDDKGQVVFYGPPGTGKTFVAKQLARVLAADESRVAIVQFHPSMSYEDFFEGYRPVLDDGGTMNYQLVAGPLARMAERATAAPQHPHYLVIDEINRANLPKVLGELLFLLEYRNEAIQTLYRPDDQFSLPKNLFFIGTMNTADRSIALVDAALRRRFHFVPFFPEQDHMHGLLGRFLEANAGDKRIAALVQKVNQELVDEIGEHLQIGPSYFMRPDLDETALRRIWEYSIEPYIEEQLFGQPKEAKRYAWAAVRERHWSTLSGSEDSPAVLEALDDEG